MSSAVNDDPQAAYLTPDQLRMGVFVMLDVAWFKHSFALSNFKIRTEDQLRELRALQLPRYRFDPLRSDPAPELPVAPDLAGAPALDSVQTGPTAALTDKAQRMARVRQHRNNIDQVEKAFTKAATVMKSLNRNIHARPRETLEEMGALVDDMVTAFLGSADATLHVMSEKAGGEDVYFHSLNVTILAMMLARGLNLTPEATREMGVGAMLHDVGLLEIPDRIAKKPASEASRAERNLRATHVELGVALGQRVGLSAQALAVVAQHHEFEDGSGYPKGLSGDAMERAAKVVSMVNFYDNLCNPADVARAMTPHEALSYMFAQCRSKFDLQPLQLLIRSLGVHPPGSILLLSDQTLAVVTSVNLNKPLRPWVLVYDENIPKEEAIILNLELEPSLSIIKAVRPAQLSPKVAAYLNPRKRVTYFFDTSATDDPNRAG